MRIMFDKDHVLEFISIDASPCWCEKDGTTEDNPLLYSVVLYISHPGDDEDEFCNIQGNYNLDGTIETYQAAVKNFEEICEQLLTKGYCRASDFKNFDWL